MARTDGWRLPSDPPECPEGGVVPVIVGLLMDIGEWDLHAAYYANKRWVEPISSCAGRPKRYEVNGFVCYNDVDGSFDEINIEAWHPFPDPPAVPL